MVVMVVVVLGALVVDFAVRCRVDEKCGVDGWRGPKSPFKLPRNHPFEGELLCFGEHRYLWRKENLRRGEEEWRMHP